MNRWEVTRRDIDSLVISLVNRRLGLYLSTYNDVPNTSKPNKPNTMLIEQLLTKNQKFLKIGHFLVKMDNIIKLMSVKIFSLIVIHLR